jgi:hypothetical protein
MVASVFVAAPPATAVVACTSTAAGQLARWPGDNDATEVAHGRDGSLVGDTTFAAGEVNQAFTFDGAGDTVTVPDSPDWTLGGDFTIDTWVNFASIPVSGHVVLVAHDQGAGYQPKWILCTWTASALRPPQTRPRSPTPRVRSPWAAPRVTTT